MAKAKVKKKGKAKTKKAVKKVIKKTVKKKVAKKASKKVVKTAKSKKTVKKAVTAKSFSGLRVGEKVPDLTLPATGGKSIRMSDLAGQKVVLYFYPKDMTPGCTIEGREFTQLKDQFSTRNTVVLGVSRDTVDLHEKFKTKENYSIDLLSDTDEKMCSIFGVMKDKNMYGKKVRGIERSTFVIDESGQVVKEWRGVKAEGHAQEVLNYLSTGQ